MKWSDRGWPLCVPAIALLCFATVSACDVLDDSPLTPVESTAAIAPQPQGKTNVVVADTFTGQRYIVRLRDDVADHRGLARSLLAAHGGRTIHVYDQVFKGFNAVLPNEQAVEAIRRNPNVVYLEADELQAPDATQSPVAWGLDRIDRRSGLDNAYNYFFTGAGVDIYVIDTGVMATHQDFGGRFGPVSGTAVYPYDPYQDCHGHGTRVASAAAGTRAGVAKGARINPLQAGNCNGQANSGDIAWFIDFIAQNAPRPGVINLSYSPSSGAVAAAAQGAINAGFTFVTSAGNANANACSGVPLHSVTNVVVVGASTSSDSRWSSSNYGSCVDIFAPGAGVEVASLSGGYTTTSGTSFSAPYTAGTAALILQQLPNVIPSYVKNVIEESSSRNRLSNIGTGSPNRLLYAPHTYLSLISGPQQVGNGTYIWSVNTLGGNGNYTYSWYIDYDDNSEYDDEYPPVTGPKLTWNVDRRKGSFTLGVSVMTYSDGLSRTLHVEVLPECSPFC